MAHESFEIRLKRDGALVPVVEAADESGLILHGETDAFPRKFFLEFDSPSSVTRFRMRAVQRLNGWHPWEFKLRRSITDDGCLSFRGDGPRALPPGHYWIRPFIEDLVVGRGRRLKVRIEEGATSVIEVSVASDKRRIELTRPVSEWDPGMRRVASRTRIDGRTVAKWLDRKGVRESRKACFLNILAGLRGTTFENRPLLDSVEDVFFAGVDRVYTRASAELYRVVVALAADPKRRFYAEGRPKARIHEMLLTRAQEKFGLDPKAFTLESYRSEGGPSAQIVFGVPGLVAHEHLAEIDVDLGNPLQDVRGFVVHMGELLDAGRTDHLELRKKLARRKSLAPFLYYKVRRS